MHPAVLALGSALAKDDEDAATALFEKIAGRPTAKPSRGLYAAERRLLAFLRTHRQAQARERRAQGPRANGPRTGTPRRSQPVASAKRTLSPSSAMA